MDGIFRVFQCGARNIVAKLCDSTFTLSAELTKHTTLRAEERGNVGWKIQFFNLVCAFFLYLHIDSCCINCSLFNHSRDSLIASYSRSEFFRFLTVWLSHRKLDYFLHSRFFWGARKTQHSIELKTFLLLIRVYCIRPKITLVFFSFRFLLIIFDV